MKLRTIIERDYPLLMELDKKVYPTDDPVTPEIFNQWFKNNPEFGMIYSDNNQTLANAIVIPLNKEGWEGLISGKLLESDLNSNYIFDNKRDSELCLHVYHIEKLSNRITSFHSVFLTDISKLIKQLKVENTKLNVSGFSGLCVTSSGIDLFYNKFNCHENEFLNSEVILSKRSEICIGDEESKQQLEKLLSEGWTYENRCKMLVLKPENYSIVWNYLN